MQLNEDNKYPVLFYSPASMEEATTTLAFNNEEKEELIRKGWLLNYRPREYPKAIPTGKMNRVQSPWDNGFTEVPEKIVVANAEAEKALLAKLSAPVAPVAQEKRGPGRPPSVKNEDLVSA